MAVKLRTVVQNKSAEKNFVGRHDLRKAFWQRYDKMVKEGTTIISFYGAGGIGKSTLLTCLVNEIDQRKIKYGNVFKNVHVLYHDFVNGTDKRQILNQWKGELQKVGCEFPYFETGDFYLSLKQGAKNIDRPQMKTWIEKNKWMSEIRNKLDTAGHLSDNAIPGVNAIAAVMDITSDAINIFPGVKSVTSLIGFVDNMLSNRAMDKKLDENVDLREQLNEKAAAHNPDELAEFLPILFARDVADWAGNDKKFIIFLDTYELLTNAGSNNKLSSNNLYRDSWIRNDPDGLIFNIPNTLWVIAGRHKLNWKSYSGDLESELDQHLLISLPNEDTISLLKTAGIDNENLCSEILKLTKGYPIYLDECIKTYNNQLSRGDVELKIADIACQSREKVVERLLKYLDSSARTMIYSFSILGRWTNEIASKAIPNFNYNIYIKAKDFSFVQSSFETVDGKEKEILNLDEILQDLLFQFIKEHKTLSNLIKDLTLSMNQLAKHLESQGQFDELNILRKRINELCQEINIKIDDDSKTDNDSKISDDSDKKIDTTLTDNEINENKVDNDSSINVSKGQKISLTNINSDLNELTIKVECQTDYDIELDTSAFLLGANGKAAKDEDFIFYGNTKHNSNSVEINENEIKIDLSKIPNDIKKIAITLTIYSEHNFSQVKSAKVRIMDHYNNKEILQFDFGNNLSNETAIVIGEIYRHKDQWKFNAVGAGFNGGLEVLCKHFGVEVE